MIKVVSAATDGKRTRQPRRSSLCRRNDGKIAGIGFLNIALTGTRARLGAQLTWITIALLEIPMFWLTSLITFHLVRTLDRNKTAFEDLSRQDGLTGVWNYRALHEHLGGDRAKAHVGETLKSSVRSIDQLLSQADLALLTRKRLKREAPPSSRPAVPRP